MTGKKNDIILDNLSIGYKSRKGERIVAKGISATIKGGELTCLLGPNGAGKSTLLRTLAAFQPRCGGSISICGRSIDDYKAAEMAKVVAIVLTDKPDAKNMTVGELVAMGRSPYTGFWGTLSDSDRNAIAEAMATVGIESMERRNISTLSDGERQKAMIAKAMAQQTPAVLLDEPTAFLDFASKADTMRLLRRISHSLGKVVLMSTHDLDLALQTADTLWLLGNDGQIAIGTPEDMAVDGRLQAFFAHDGIVFDAQTGLFTTSNETECSIGVAGPQGLRLTMLCKALNRNGMSPAPPHADRPEITVGDDTFTISANGNETTVSTISDAVETVKRCIGKPQ